MQRPPDEAISIAMETIPEQDALTSSQPDNCKAKLSGSLRHGTGNVSSEAIRATGQVANARFRKLPLTRKVFYAILEDPICLCVAWALGILVVTGSIFSLTFLAKPSSLAATIPHDFISSDSFLTNGQPIDGERRWLDEFSHSVKPRECHSHNDYWRPYPLFSALAAGCSSVEADVWITDDGTDLLVGHDQTSLTGDRTLASMYLEPLLNILNSVNEGTEHSAVADMTQRRGVFRTDPDATLVLLIDVKSESSSTWSLVMEQLSALRDKQYLTRYEGGGLIPGTVTVVGSGNVAADQAVFLGTNATPNRPFDDYHDAFLDVLLASLPRPIEHTRNADTLPTNTPDQRDNKTWTNATAYYASASFRTTIGSVMTGFSPSQLSTLRGQISAAARLGLRSRYWDTPDWPVGYREYVWGVLEREGVGVLNVDDLEGAARRSWDATGGTWVRDVAWMTAVGVWVVCCGVAVILLGWQRRRKVVPGVSEGL